MELEDCFELPFRNPFRRKQETLSHFRHRCDRSTAWVKRAFDKMYGGGEVYHRDYRRESTYKQTAKTQRRPGNGLQ